MKIILSTNNYEIQVSDQWYDHLIHWKWYVNPKTGRVHRTKWIDGKNYIIYMYHVILDLLDIEHPNDADHIDQNPSNNQDENLRPLTHQQNCMNHGPNKNNTSGFKGVYFNIEKGKWSAEITFQRKKQFIGYFVHAEEAAKAYDCKALELFGEIAWLNFPGNYVLFD